MNKGRACREGEGGPVTSVGRSGFQLPKEALSWEKEPQEGMWYICPLCGAHTTHPDVLSSSPALVPRFPGGPVGLEVAELQHPHPLPSHTGHSAGLFGPWPGQRQRALSCRTWPPLP